MTEPTRQDDRYPHRRLRSVPAPTWKPAPRKPWWHIERSTISSLAWWCLYAFGISVGMAAIGVAIEWAAIALHG